LILEHTYIGLKQETPQWTWKQEIFKVIQLINA
jgi:hypothetical protein